MQLRSATGPKTVTYHYDPLGRRQSKSVSGTVTQFLSDGQEEIAEYTSSGTAMRYYLNGHGIDEHLAQVEASGTHYFYSSNHQGSILASTDGSQNIATVDYDPYGQSVVAPTAFGYTGRWFDAETGLDYYRARYYSPTLGRFLQADPIGTKDDLNLYTYVGNDPLDRTDPAGTEAATAEWLQQTQAADFSPQGSASEGLEFVGSFVPGISEVLAVKDFAEHPSVLGAAVIGASLVDAGGLVKGVAKGATKGTAAETRAANVAKGIPESRLGPSGKPKVHTVEHSTTKGANEAAQGQTPPGGKVRFDAHPQDGQKPHYQAEDANGENVKPVVHHCPPDKRC